MEVTDVKIRLVHRPSNRIKAFCTITFDNCFVIKDVRIIQGTRGFIVAMPAKRLTFKCYKCGFKNPLQAKFCSDCGRRIRPAFMRRDSRTGKPIIQVDVAHPINIEARRMIEKRVIEAYEKEFEKFKQGISQAQVSPPTGEMPEPTAPPEG